MTARNNLFKSTALILAGTFVASAAMPATSAFAHDRHNVAKHYGHGSPLTKKGHRKFHNHYGPGHQGRLTYLHQRGIFIDPNAGNPYRHFNGHGAHNHHPQPKIVYKNKKRNKGDLVAAGIIGLALGAIIAGEASKHRNYQPSYQYPPHHGNQGLGAPYNHGQHIPLEQYNQRSQFDNGGPNVITYNDEYSLEPWTPGWERWCKNRYLTFNAQTGTFRGYDGKDHFCVPK